jgi:hypothetical protein
MSDKVFIVRENIRMALLPVDGPFGLLVAPPSRRQSWGVAPPPARAGKMLALQKDVPRPRASSWSFNRLGSLVLVHPRGTPALLLHQ